MISWPGGERRSAVLLWPGSPHLAGHRQPAAQPVRPLTDAERTSTRRDGVQVFDLFIPRWPEPRPQELAPPRQLVIRLPAHAASLSGWWPLPDAVTWVTSWLTLRRDRPNRPAMARWLSGCPAVTDAAYAARTACS